MDNNFVIEANGLSKTYETKEKKKLALSDFSLNVERGTIISLMGKSGCGKSTLAKILAGIEETDSGSLKILGEDCTKGVSAKMKENIGYVFQWHNLAEWRTVEQNLYLPFELHGIKKEDYWKERANKNLDLVKLTKYRNVYPKELSGGMMQRVGIARAMMLDPQILVFDQPFGALDAITRTILAYKICKMVRDEGKTMIMITSNAEEAIQYSDRIVVMNDKGGSIRQILDTKFDSQERDDENFWKVKEHLEIKRELVNIITAEDKN